MNIKNKLKTELKELDTKISKLEKFLEENTIVEKKSVQNNLLISQLSVLKSYSTILNLRINDLINNGY